MGRTTDPSSRRSSPFPLAIAHDYLTQKGGAERVVLSLHRRWPDAPIYTTFYDPDGTFPEFRNATIITSKLNWLPVLRKDPRRALPVLRFLSSSISVQEPIAIISSSGWAHGFTYHGKTLVYCHTPARWVYLLDEYLGVDGARSVKGFAARALRPMLKKWDRRAMSRRTQIVANSTVVRERIRRVYGAEVPTVFPPHTAALAAETEPIPQAEGIATEGFLLSVARLMPYKNVGVAVEAAQLAGKNLLIIGKGPDEERLRALAKSPSVVFAKDVSDAQLAWAYAHADALIAVSYEDFGITPLEASARGVPTIALRAGGYLDTIQDGVNGLFIEEPSVDALVEGIGRLEATSWDAAAMRCHAELFSESRFVHEVGELVETLFCA